ncbi:MAG TPA: 4Fe-4S dicluster domain-containing protein, partial [Acetobacteraceae bacterium]|nr:4Fe-4S dicluster domain-containing protein [Acetobacteraceae bacterium]
PSPSSSGRWTSCGNGPASDQDAAVVAEALRHTKRGGGQLGTSPVDLPFPSLPVVDGDGQPGSRDGLRWLMASDVCKHCTHAGCLDVCPTGALFRTEFGTVVVQQDICNGCGYCVPACPFGVVDINPVDGKAHKCTLCYDRLKGGLEPACAKSCPTDSIQFGELADLQQRAHERVEKLHALGVDSAYLYGTPGGPGATGGLEHLNAFFLLTAEPEVYNLPEAPMRPSNNVAPSLATGLATVAGLALAALALFVRRA